METIDSPQSGVCKNALGTETLFMLYKRHLLIRCRKVICVFVVLVFILMDNRQLGESVAPPRNCLNQTASPLNLEA